MKNVAAKAPFFIVGCPRSGTTLLQLLLDAHPNIAIPPESHLFERFSGLFSKYGDLRNGVNLRVLVRDLLNDAELQDWGLKISLDDFLQQLKTPTIRGVISTLFEIYAAREEKSRWGDKTPQHMFYLREIERIFPEAKFIHLVRDGRDVAESLSRVLIGPKSVYSIAQRWRNYLFTFHRFKEAAPPDKCLEIRYEDLVRNPEDELRRVFAFLGEDYTDNVLALSNTGLKTRYMATDTRFFSLAQPVSDQNVGVFQKRFSRREIEIFESVAADALKLYGYSLATSGKVIIKPHERVWFLVQDRYIRYQRKLLTPEGRRQVIRKDLRPTIQLKLRKIRRSIGGRLVSG